MGLIKADKKGQSVALLVMGISAALILATLFIDSLETMLACIPAIPLIIAAAFLLRGYNPAIIWIRVLVFPLCFIGGLFLLWCGRLLLRHHIPKSEMPLLLVALLLCAFIVPFVLSIKWRLAKSVSLEKLGMHYCLSILAMLMLYTPLNGLIYFYGLYKFSNYVIADVPGNSQVVIESRTYGFVDSDTDIAILSKNGLIINRRLISNEPSGSGQNLCKYNWSNDGKLLIYRLEARKIGNIPACVYDFTTDKLYSINEQELDKASSWMKVCDTNRASQDELTSMIIKHGGIGPELKFYRHGSVEFALKYFCKFNL